MNHTSSTKSSLKVLKSKLNTIDKAMEISIPNNDRLFLRSNNTKESESLFKKSHVNLYSNYIISLDLAFSQAYLIKLKNTSNFDQNKDTKGRTFLYDFDFWEKKSKI